MTDTADTQPCPYKSLPATSFWRRSVSTTSPEDVDPVLNPKFSISASDRVATAGSCFAQNIARYLKSSGFNYFVTEPGHPVLEEAQLTAFNYGTFSARYGNVYTTRQLLQMLQRAYGEYQPVDDIWREDEGFIDPFRPFIQPGGFVSEVEYWTDRQQHLAAIRRIVEESDVFVFTLGLTEAWENTADGSVYALCPGCGAGQHRPAVHRFRNFTVAEVSADLNAAIEFITARNPNIRVLLTVSPVPLIATFENQHVLTATTYSKSVLRVAAQMATDAFAHVDYFPSYEIFTSNFSRGTYYGPDLREIEESGVRHAMRCFFGNYLEGGEETAPGSDSPSASSLASRRSSEQINNLICDEENLE